jgi:hypothetical protein
MYANETSGYSDYDILIFSGISKSVYDEIRGYTQMILSWKQVMGQSIMTVIGHTLGTSKVGYVDSCKSMQITVFYCKLLYFTMKFSRLLKSLRICLFLNLR